jgi:hypothetical protein
MRRLLSVAVVALTVVAQVCLASAQSASQPKAGDMKVEKRVAIAQKAEPLSASGKVEKVDQAAKTFTVKTREGDRQFALGSDVKITAGAKTGKISDLPNKTVKVTYVVIDGRNVASKVTIASPQKPESQTAKKAERK